MEILKFIDRTTKHMLDYQRNKNTIKQCLANCSYLYDCIKYSRPRINAEVIPVIVMYNSDEETVNICAGHVVIMITHNEKKYLIDPSYDIYSIENKSYFFNVSAFIKSVPEEFRKRFNDNMRETVSEFLKFSKLAQDINNDVCLVADKVYYHDQADYIDIVNMKTT